MSQSADVQPPADSPDSLSGEVPPRIACESSVSHVSLFARGAEITRTVDLDGLDDETRQGTATRDIVLEGITAAAIASSFRVEVEGEGAATSVRTAWRFGKDSGPPGEVLLEWRVNEIKLKDVDERMRTTKQSLQWFSAAIDMGHRIHGRNFDPAREFGRASSFMQVQAELRTFLQEHLQALKAEQRELKERAEELIVLIGDASSTELMGDGLPVREAIVRVEGEVSGLRVCYRVASARWWPDYRVHFDPESGEAEIEMRAQVVQQTHEDWVDAEISLSTASPTEMPTLNKLKSWRLGKAQSPTQRDFREPHGSIADLFKSHDAYFGHRPASGGRPSGSYPASKPTAAYEASSYGELSAPQVQAFGSGSLDEQPQRRSKKRTRSAAPPSAPPPQMIMAAPANAPAPSGGMAPPAPKMAMGAHAASPPPPVAPPPAAPQVREPDAPDDGLLNFDNLTLSQEGRNRGRLVPAPASRRQQHTSSTVEHHTAPTFAVDPVLSAGFYDYVYTSNARVDIPSDAKLHLIPVRTAKAKAEPYLVAVPREAEEVYRALSMVNPFDTPLLAGPLEAFVGNTLVSTNHLNTVDAGGDLRVALGAEERVTIARNATMHESESGMIRGKTHARHDIEITIKSALSYPAGITVLDRIPVSHDDEIKVELVTSEPQSDPYDQSERLTPIEGGRRWRIKLDAGGDATIHFAYDIILSAKREVVGGNRREQ